MLHIKMLLGSKRTKIRNFIDTHKLIHIAKFETVLTLIELAIETRAYEEFKDHRWEEDLIAWGEKNNIIDITERNTYLDILTAECY